MLRRVALRTEQTLLFAGPEGDANGAARLDVERLQDADGFHGHDGAGAIVGGAGAGDPAVEVTAHHHHLFLEPRVGSGDLGHGVECVFVLAGDLRLDVDFHADRHVRLGQPIEAAVALDGRHHDRNLHALVGT